MLRALLLGILAVSATAACKDAGDAPTVQPGVAAGKVLDLEGTVTATRGGTTRTLAKGSEVSGDDEIATAADGAVTIVLAHNNARWDLNANKRGKVGDSDAWTMAKQTGPVASVDEVTTAAGRHAEKTASTTGTTSEQSAPGRGVPSPPVAGAPPTEVAAVAKNEKADNANMVTSRTDSAPPKTPSKTISKSADAMVDRKEPAQEAEGGSREKTAPETLRAPVAVEDDFTPKGGSPSDGKGTSQAPRPGGSAPAPVPTPTISTQATEALHTHRAAILKCLEGDDAAATVSLIITLGKATFKVTGAKDDAKVSTCLRPIASKLSFESSKTPVRIQFKR